MKKFLIALFALLAAVAVCACGGNTDKTSENGASSTVESLQSSEEIAQSESKDLSLESGESSEEESSEEESSEEESSEEESSEDANVTSEWVDIEFPRPQ